MSRRSGSSSRSRDSRSSRDSRRSRTPSRNSHRARDNPEPSNIIGVFGLSSQVDERELQDIFDKPGFGKIDRIQIIRDHMTRRSRGYGFIYFHDIEGAKAARKKMANAIIHGKEIRVDFSTTKGPHFNGTSNGSSRHSGRRDSYSPPRRVGGGMSARGGPPPRATPNRCIGVFNLNPRTNEMDLERTFCRFGKIDQVRVIMDHRTGHSKGFGFVYFLNTQDAVEARHRMDGKDIQGSYIRVDFSATNAQNESNGRNGGYREQSPPRGRYNDRSPRSSRGGASEYRSRRSRSPPPQRYRQDRSRSPPRRRSSPPQAARGTSVGSW